MNSKNVQKFEKKLTNLKNVHDFKYMHKFFERFMILKIVHNFMKLRVIVYHSDVAKCGHGR